MKTILAILTVLFVALLPHTAQADTSTTTMWGFHVLYSTDESYTWTDPTMQNPVSMPFQFQWKCEHTPIKELKDGSQYAGFMCVSNDKKFVSIVAICDKTPLDTDRASATLGDDKHWVKFTATCLTVTKKDEVL